MHTTPFDEKVLLNRVSNGDELAFTHIYEFYQHKIFTYALKILHTEILAEEVLQETMLKLWLMGHRLNAIHNLDTYLKVTARNKCIDLLRQQAVVFKRDQERSLFWNEGHNFTEEQVLLNDTRKILGKGISLLPKQQQQVYQLSRQEGLKTNEIAERLNLSPSTVQTHLKLALRFLRNHLKQHTNLVISVLLIRHL